MAVKVIVSAFEYTGVEIVTLFALVAMLPVKVPLKVPPPLALLNVIVVVLVGLDGFLEGILRRHRHAECRPRRSWPPAPWWATNWLAAAAVMLKLLLMVPVSPLPAAEKFKLVPASRITRSLNVALPVKSVSCGLVPL